MKTLRYNGNDYEVKESYNRMYQKNLIRKQQRKIKDSLVFEDGGYTVYTQNEDIELSPGCKSCKAGTWWCLFMGNNCNSRCKFCSQPKDPAFLHKWSHPETITIFWMEDVKFYLDMGADKLTGVSYTGGEPTLYLDRVEAIAKHIRNNHNHLYQWLYTNGILLSKDHLKMMRDVGIQEIRFDLAATDFNELVVKKLEWAREIIGRVTVEVPSIPEVYTQLVEKDNLKRIIDLGATQLNLAELSLRQPVNFKHYGVGKEVYGYDTYDGKTYSPLNSRLLTYEIIKCALDNKLDILINDCSQDAKHVQRVMRKESAPSFVTRK